MDDDGPGVGEGCGAGDADDQPLLDLLDALVNDRGPTGAAEALGVNYRTVTRCQRSRRVTRRMRQVLQEFRDSQDVNNDGPDVGAGDGTRADGAGESQHDRVAALEQENRELRETVEAQAQELDALRRQVADLEERDQPMPGDDAVDGGQGQPGDWRPPRRRPGMPDVGVVTLEEQPDEAHAFGPAALVSEWRQARLSAQAAGSRVDRAVARVRRWELEVEFLRDFHLTLPPETEPLDESRRKDHVRWRQEALAEARRELGRAKRMRLLRRVISLGLWRK